MSTIHDILEELKQAATDPRDKGDKFERFIANYLKADPQYSNILSDVWLWLEWPDRGNRVDTGIDLVAKVRDTGEYWAIQCKFFDPSHILQKGDIDPFFTASGQKFITNDGEHSFSTRLIISTTDKWSKHAEEALEDQTIPVVRLRVQDLGESPIDWSQFSLAKIDDIRLRKKKELREHQIEALEATKKGFQIYDRGKLIMACGTGKTFTSQRIAEEITPDNGRVLFLAPSISLISQALREWNNETTDPFHSFVVCSDSKVGKENEDIRTHDLAYPATTNAHKLAHAMKSASSDRRTVVFSTYQSIQVVADAQKEGIPEFDVIICDEAHRTTGITLDKEDTSNFVKIHDPQAIKSKKRLYMTATPRIYAEASKSKADKANASLYSMDDESIYGPEFYRLGFGKAVTMDLLTEYKVLIVAVDEERMAALANEYNAFKIDSKKAIDSRFATKVIGSWKGLSKQGWVQIEEDGSETVTENTAPMRQAVAFSRTIKDSKDITEVFNELVNLYSQTHRDGTEQMVHCTLDHVDGEMNALRRQKALEWLKESSDDRQCRILSNARCLSEGIDVPALDSVIFFDTRESIVDIVQSVGRVMRKSEGKEYGYILLPVGIPSTLVKDYNSYIEEDPQFKGIWKVIKALRAHDESLVDEAVFRRKVIIKTPNIGPKQRDGGKPGDGEQLPLDFPVLPIDAISEAVYAVIPKKLGDLEYWRDWAKNVAQIAERLMVRIRELLQRPDAKTAFDWFVTSLHKNLNPAVSENEAIEMLSQHILTRPVFEALFEGYSFTQNNPVSKSMQAVIELMDEHVVSSETEGLESFYENIRERVQLAKSDKSRQEIVKNLYDTFFNSAFPRMAERLGIVYTPIEVVDFILHSAEFALQEHFKSSLSDKGVQILDPFTGTGTFMVRLLQSGLIKPEDLLRKYQEELHANEIVLLAYYIAAINIESAFHAQYKGEYQPFSGIVLTDTFQTSEDQDFVDTVILPKNSERVLHQKQQDIRVIVSNPPYSAGQKSANDNNQNLKYTYLDDRIKNTYAKYSTATNKNSLYDSYIRAIRWASDRIQDKGVIAFVTNGSFIDSNAADGLRKSLTSEFSHLYVFNLRGNQRTSGELSRQEGGKIFGSGSRTPVAITLMIKNPDYAGPCQLHYHDIGDYLDRKEKLSRIQNFKSIQNVPWNHITPNTNGDWINQRDPVFKTFMELGNKEDNTADVIFKTYSRGVATSRDAWVYNFSRKAVETNMQRMISVYNGEVDRYLMASERKANYTTQKTDNFLDTDSKNISWSRGLKADAEHGIKYEFEPDSIVLSHYRPYTKQWLYFNRRFNDMVYQMPRLFPTPAHHNLVISITGVGASKEFSALISSTLPNLHLHDTGQCFPLYWYERVKNNKPNGTTELFSVSNESPDAEGYVRHDAVSNWAMGEFRKHYQDEAISKEDIFYYVYGILHSPEYKQRFAADLKKMLPRIPYTSDFWAFSEAGRKLADWHLNYETVEPYPLDEISGLILNPKEDYRVQKMKFLNGKTDKSVIVYNNHITLSGIPLEAYDYIVNGKSALEWIMERYQITQDKDSGLENDPNLWSDDPRYILDLVKRIVRVSLETIKIIHGLPTLKEAGTSIQGNKLLSPDMV